jgi:dsDNA-specific endonuclease/ATPase MutS2
MKLKLDLHAIYSNDRAIDDALHGIMDEAIEKRAEHVEIIPGKGSGQLKKSVLRFLENNYKGKFSRIEKDDKNFGRIFVHFNWNKLSRK